MFTLTIETENDAFTDNPGAEVARILREVARLVEGGRDDGRLFDVNGNKVGRFELVAD